MTISSSKIMARFLLIGHSRLRSKNLVAAHGAKWVLFHRVFTLDGIRTSQRSWNITSFLSIDSAFHPVKAHLLLIVSI